MKKAIRYSFTILLILLGLCGSALAESSPVGGRFMMQDHNGQVLTDRAFQGQFMLITFGYTFCPDICPTNLSDMSQALDILGDKASDVVPIFVTVDPDRDGTLQLRDYVSHFHPRMVGLTGSDAMIKRMAESYKVIYDIQKPEDSDEEQYLIDHTASMFLMAPDGRFLVKFMHGIDPADMAQRIGDFL